MASATVGLAEVLQTTPFAVIATPPSLEIAPPEDDELYVTELDAVVVNVGTGSAKVVNELSAP